MCLDLASRLAVFLAAQGVAATYVRVSTTGYDTATGRTTRTETQTAIVGAFVSFNDFGMPPTSGAVANESKPRTGRRKFTIAGNALAQKPAVNDRVDVMSESFRVEDMEAQYFGNAVVAFTLTLLKV